MKKDASKGPRLSTAPLTQRTSGRVKVATGKRVPRRTLVRGVKHPEFEILARLRKRFAIWATASSAEQLRGRLQRFVPDGDTFQKTLSRADLSREDYVDSLLKPGKLSRRIAGINRGATLVAAAARWVKPTAGHGKDSARARGLQWRTTMSWAGVELIRDCLFPREMVRKANLETEFEWCRLLGLSRLNQEIPVPTRIRRSAKVRNMWREETDILEFLDVRDGGPRKALDTWWIKQSPVSQHAAALKVARAIRDVTSHGLLSARRVQDFGLVSPSKAGTTALGSLVDVMVHITIETLNRLLASDTKGALIRQKEA